MSRTIGIASLALALVAAFSVYALKYQVQQLEGELRHLRGAAVAEHSRLSRLRTEWAMLNQPGRLARLAATHLELEPARPLQIVTIDDLPFRRDLELDRRRWAATLPSGGAVVLRLKPFDRPHVLPALQRAP